MPERCENPVAGRAAALESAWGLPFAGKELDEVVLLPALPDLAARGAAFIEAHAEWAGVIIFLVAFAEGLVVLGLLVPGVVLLTAAGGLVAAGVLDFWTIYPAIAIGGILGEAVSYWLGRLWGERMFQVWPFRNYPGLLRRGQDFFERHGGKSVFLSRFMGPLRAVVPTTAGIAAMPHRKFQLFNIASALIWASLLMSPGYAAWTGFEMSSVGERAAPADPASRPEQDGRRSCGIAPPAFDIPSDRDC